jgi:predicted DNA-binding protein (MmcQ/YjbR family)
MIVAAHEARMIQRTAEKIRAGYHINARIWTSVSTDSGRCSL